MEIKKQEMMKTRTGEIARLPKSICRRIEDGRPDVKRLARLNELPEMPQAPPANCGKLHLIAPDCAALRGEGSRVHNSLFQTPANRSLFHHCCSSSFRRGRLGQEASLLIAELQARDDAMFLILFASFFSWTLGVSFADSGAGVSPVRIPVRTGATPVPLKAMIVCLHIPKTGGTSFNVILENSFGIRNCHTNQTNRSTFTQADFEFARKCYPGMRSHRGPQPRGPRAIEGAGPVFHDHPARADCAGDFALSIQRAERPQQKSFDETLRASENLENLQVKLIAGGRDLDKAKRFLERCAFVGLTEKFDLSLRVLERLSPWKLQLNYERRVVAKSNEVKDRAGTHDAE